jgi:flavin-dependent dehydrogenase
MHAIPPELTEMIRLPQSTDVFVIGGGPAGLAAAIAARRRGFDVTVADCSVPPMDKACGEGIMPDGLNAARWLGLDLDVDSAQHFNGIRFCESGAAVEAVFPNGSGLGLRRTTLHRLMVDRAVLEGVRLVWGARLTGICQEGVHAGGRLVRARWIVGADGGQSPVRRWANLDACVHESRRFGFRRHYAVAPWSEFMEIHWGDHCQLYITPVAAREVCIVLLSGNPCQRLDDALPQFPEVLRRVRGAENHQAHIERGGISTSRRLKSVYRGNVALVGDASGSVDAITGEGLCLLFQHALALAGALESGDLAIYQAEHRRIGRRPQIMSDLMLLLATRGRLRSRAMRAFAGHPALFASMLAMHIGEVSPMDYFTNSLAFGWRMLTA